MNNISDDLKKVFLAGIRFTMFLLPDLPDVFWHIHIYLFYMYTGGVYNRTGFTPINKKVE